MTFTLHCGDCRDVLRVLPDCSVDAVVTDPPYPEISRDYGRLTEAQWWTLMVEGVIPEVRRVLKPTGSAVFILQPNSRKVGSMRGWLWEFMAWVCREWNMVQDVWWWNIAVMPCAGATQHGLTREGLKACVWAGNPECYRNQDNVLFAESERNAVRRKADRFDGRVNRPSGHSETVAIFDSAEKRGGVTPFNVLPFANTSSTDSAGANGHGAGTPIKLADWWTRYIVPPGGVILDPFNGAGTMGVAAVNNGCSYIGIDKEQAYIDISRRRIQEAAQQGTVIVERVVTEETFTRRTVTERVTVRPEQRRLW